MNIPASFQANRLLRDVTTLGIGGPARYFVEIRTIIEMQQALHFCARHHLPFFVLGKGSNCLFDDQGFHGVVLANHIDFCEYLSDDTLYVGAGYSFSLLGTQTARKGLTGLEFASGIPGSVGGAVFMNAGANGMETCETLVAVDFVTLEGECLKIQRSDLTFAYRYSSFHAQQGAIVGATFKLKKCPQAREKQLKIIQYRKQTQPYSEKSAGCIFRNPTCQSAGALIDQVGLKGKKMGDAQVSSVHANFLINANQATAQEIRALILFVKTTVKEKTGIELESEVRDIDYDWTPF